MGTRCPTPVQAADTPRARSGVHRRSTSSAPSSQTIGHPIWEMRSLQIHAVDRREIGAASPPAAPRRRRRRTRGASPVSRTARTRVRRARPGSAVVVVLEHAHQITADRQSRCRGAQNQARDLVGPGQRRFDRDQRAHRVPDQHRWSHSDQRRQLAGGVAIVRQRRAGDASARSDVGLGPCPGRSIATARVTRREARHHHHPDRRRCAGAVDQTGTGAAPARRSPRSA